MKAWSLLFMQVSTGLLCVIWGLIRVGDPAIGAKVNGEYYGGILTGEAIQYAWGGFLLIVGLLTILGLLRRYVYLAQAAILCMGALAIWKYLIDPLGLWLLDRETSQVLFFPSLGMAAATLVLLAFRDEGRIALDIKFNRP